MSDQPVIRRDGATSPIIKNVQRSYILTNQSQAGSDLTLTRSQSLYEEAQTLLPGGVNSPARAFRGVGGNPVFMDHASGPYLYDVDGNRYLDYVQSWGPMILGYGYPSVVEAVIEACKRGFSFGASTQPENELAKLELPCFPSVGMVRFINSSTAAPVTPL